MMAQLAVRQSLQSVQWDISSEMREMYRPNYKVTNVIQKELRTH
jgi:hypothetical protein